MLKTDSKYIETTTHKIFDFLNSEVDSNEFDVISGYVISGNSITFTLNANEEKLEQKLSFRILAKDSRDKIYEYIEKNPLLAAEIISGNIPDSFINSLLELEIPLLPFKKTEVSVKGQVGKKYQKTILNYIISIINQDKSLVLELRGITPEELIQAALRAEYKREKSKFLYIDTPEVAEETHDFHSIYTLEPLACEDIFSDIPNNPKHFDKKEFKSKVIEIYDLLSTEFDSVFNINENNTPVRKTSFYLTINEKSGIEFYASPTTNFEYFLKSKGSLFRCKKGSVKLPFYNEENLSFEYAYSLNLNKDTVYDYFLSFNTLVENEDFSKSSIFLNKLMLFAKEIVRTLNIRPFVDEVNDELFKISYLPDYSNQKLNEVVKILESVMPVDLGLHISEEKIISKSSVIPLLNDLVNYITYKILSLKGSKIKSNPISNIFTQNKPSKLVKNNKNISQSINNWLKYLEMKNHDISLLLKIDRISDEFCTASIEVQNKDNSMLTLSDIFSIADNKQLKDAIATKISAASEYMPLLKDIYISNGNYKPQIAIIDVIKFSTNLYVSLGNFGIDILIPKELKNIIKPRASVKAKLKNQNQASIEELLSNNNSVFSLDDIMEFQYEVSLGDEKLSKDEFLLLVKDSGEIIKYKNQYILLKPEEIDKIIKQLNQPIEKDINSLQLIHSSFSGMLDDIELDYDEMIKDAINKHLKTAEIDTPSELLCELRPYQENGFKWLYSNISKGFGSCIADDMGLGKTVQVLSLLLKLKSEGKLNSQALVICPTTLVGNWKKESEKFTPTLKVSIYHGSERKFDDKADVLITTYGLLRVDEEEFKKRKWSNIIIDEAQNIKNPNTAQSKAIKSLTADNHIAMTGTPIENKLTELWSIFDFINKGYLGSIKDFQLNYSVPIEKFKENDTAEKLKLVTSPFVLRRLKTDKSIINDLPDKISFDEYCYLTPEQAALYEKILNSTMDNIEGSSGINRKGNVLKLITSLKQICNHPTNFLKNNNYNIDISGKTQKTISILEKILESNEKALIFTQYKEMGEILQRIISSELSAETVFFHGSLSRPNREQLINKFQTDDATKFMILSLKAGGTGLNLTAATNVIHYDLWWNPAVENQATDRTYRIGQKKNVTVHRLITIGTFEEKIDEMLRNKKELVDISLHTGEKMITELSNDELYEIFSLR